SCAGGGAFANVQSRWMGSALHEDEGSPRGGPGRGGRRCRALFSRLRRSGTRRQESGAEGCLRLQGPRREGVQGQGIGVRLDRTVEGQAEALLPAQASEQEEDVAGALQAWALISCGRCAARFPFGLGRAPSGFTPSSAGGALRGEPSALATSKPLWR